MTVRMESPDLKLMAAATDTQRTCGENRIKLPESLVETVRQRRRIRGEVKTLTTGPASVATFSARSR